METKELLSELEKMKSALDARQKEQISETVAVELKNIDAKIDEVKNAKAENTVEFKSLQDSVIAMKGEMKGLQDYIDKVSIKMRAVPIGAGAQKGFGVELGEKLQAKEAQLKEFRASKKGFGSIELESKAVGNMGSTASLTGSYFVAPTVVPGVAMKPYESIHMRDILPVGSTNSNVVRYVRDNGGEGGPAMVAEAGTKPQQDRDLQIYDANVRKIATYFRVPEEMINDIPYLQTFLTQIGLEEVAVVEDTQILYGDGTGQNLSGLFTNATAFAASTSVVTAPNNFDVLRAAKKQGRVAKTNPTVALVSPVDFYDMTSKKDTTNNYLFLGGGNGLDATGTLNTGGLRIIEHTAIVVGDFLVLDPRNAAIFDQTGTSVRFYDQDQDNAIKNLITIVIEKRLALPIFRTDGIIKGTFATAITDLTS